VRRGAYSLKQSEFGITEWERDVDLIGSFPDGFTKEVVFSQSLLLDTSFDNMLPLSQQIANA